MPWIKVIDPDEARDVLKEQYDEAIGRAGKVWNIVSIMSQNPAAMKGSMSLYLTLMHGRSPLSRSQREMLATVVSAINLCFY